jgi:shikimate kinase
VTSGRSLVLVGYRGAGKSTVGAMLAARLGVGFVDTDALVERLTGEPVAKLFASGGEARFREAEVKALEALDAARPCIVATGGGAVITDRGRRAIRGLGTVVWLRASAAVLSARIAGSDRPPLTGLSAEAEVEALLEARAPLYASLADAIVDAGERPAVEICDDLQQLWRGLQGHDLR